MINEHILGHITDITEDGVATITAPLPSVMRACDRKYGQVEIIIPDGRRISPEQRRKVFAIIGEISVYVNGRKEAPEIEETKDIMKWQFILERMESLERKMFSLSNCDMTTARNFIDFLIEFCIKNHVPMAINPLEYCEDISKYIYACCASRVCAVCGQKADIHHITGSKVGMGNNREIVHHLGREVLPLCRAHHDDCHHDEQAFMKQYHLQPIKLDEKLCKILNLKK